MDIVGDDDTDTPCAGSACRVGYLCSTVEEYAQAIREVLSMDQVDRMHIAAAARRWSSGHSFVSWLQACVSSTWAMLTPPIVLPTLCAGKPWSSRTLASRKTFCVRSSLTDTYQGE